MLAPFLDKSLEPLNLVYISTKSKNQIILSKDHNLFRLLINKIYEQNAHVGREHKLSLLRKHFWIVVCRGLKRYYRTVFTAVNSL